MTREPASGGVSMTSGISDSCVVPPDHGKVELGAIHSVTRR